MVTWESGEGMGDKVRGDEIGEVEAARSGDVVEAMRSAAAARSMAVVEGEGEG